MNVVLKLVSTVIIMLVLGVGKGVARKIQGSDYGVLTWAISLICLWIITDIWFFNALFFKKSEKNNLSLNSHVSEVTNEREENNSENTMNNDEFFEIPEIINEDELYLQATKEVDVEKESLGLEGLVPQYLWETSKGEERSGLKLHYVTYLPERTEEGEGKQAQISGFLDSFTDPVTGSVREKPDCVPLCLTGAMAPVLAGRIFKSVGFNPDEKNTLPVGSVFLDLRPEATGEPLRGEDGEMLAVYVTSAAITGRVFYVPPMEFEPDDE